MSWEGMIFNEVGADPERGTSFFFVEAKKQLQPGTAFFFFFLSL